MRGLVKKVVIAVLAFGVIAGAAYAAVGELDPATVPQGFFALGNRTTDAFKVKVGSGPERVYHDGAEVTAQHIAIPAGASSGWHSHGGAVFVQVVSGTLTLYGGDDPTCSPTQITSGHGFVEGPGIVHDVRNEGSTQVDLYATYLLAPGTTGTGLFQPQPPNSNAACPFPS